MKNFTIGSFIITVICLIVDVMISGYIASMLWEWFIVPVFKLPLLSVSYAIGISMFVRYITTDLKIEDNLDLEKSMIDAIAKALAALSVGWIALFFI